jgi:hypothetical protein
MDWGHDRSRFTTPRSGKAEAVREYFRRARESSQAAIVWNLPAGPGRTATTPPRNRWGGANVIRHGMSWVGAATTPDHGEE